MSVKRCQQEIDSAEFMEWMLYYELEPFGEWRADLRAGILAATMANTQRTHKTQPFRPQQFMPTFAPRERAPAPPPRQTLEQQRAIFEMFVAAQNASIGSPNGT